MQKECLYRSGRVAYRLEGKGKAVVLLHGFGEDSHIWNQQIDFLKQHCLLIIPDLPGSGRSSLLTKEPGNTSDISIDDYGECIHALLQQEGISCCTMLGHSMGGYITLAFAEKYPGLLDGFGLIHSTAFADTEEKKQTRERGIAFMDQHGAHAFLKTSIPNLFGKRFKEEFPEKITSLVEAAAAFTKESLQQYYRAMIRRPNRAPVLESNPLPVLFVMGTEDVAAPMTEVLQQTHLPNKSYIHILPGTGHMGMWEASEALNQWILAFITR